MKHILILVWSLVFAATMSHAQSEYRARSGDMLQIEVLEDSTLDRVVLVTPDGRFVFPFAGSVRAAGRTVDQIRSSVVAELAESFAAEPTVFVSVSSLRAPAAPAAPAEPATIKIYFMGEVNTPGLREVEPGTTFLQGLSQAGGFTSFAATKRVQLRRTSRHTGEQNLSTINYRALSEGGGLARSIVLFEGDVILVPERRLFE